MKKVLSVLISILLMVSMFSLVGCKGTDDDVDLDGDGNIVGDKVANIEFWGWGDPDEIQVFNALTEKFNAENPNIVVKYVQKPSDGYSSSTSQALSGRSGPDVVYVGDADLKQWAALDLIAPMDEYLAKSKVIDTADIWESAMSRYRYDKETQQSGGDYPLYALPKDIGPTVTYYNETNFKGQGIEIISVFAEDMAKYNADNSKNYPSRGYFETTSAGVDVDINSATHGAKKVFNNKIAMTWEENLKLAKLLTKSYNAASPSEYGYFTEWWFNYGWSVGGDCIKFNDSTKKWEFSLGDTTRLNNANGVSMPSMKEAFTHFVQLSQPKTNDVDGNGAMGYAVSPSPDTLNTVGKSGYFTSGKTSMMVDGRWATTTYRKNIKEFAWDVAPLPKAKDGVEAGHSGSMGLAISQKTKVKNAAWKFCEFIAGPEGQKAQAKTGFNIPNQKSIANTDDFLQPDQSPKNSIIFLRAAEVQRPGDWTYLPDTMWIDKWAPTLNGDVRNGKMNLTEFFAAVTAKTNSALAEYTK